LKQLYTNSVFFCSIFFGLFLYFVAPSLLNSTGVLYNELFSSSGTKLTHISQADEQLKSTNDSLLFLINSIEVAVFKDNTGPASSDSLHLAKTHSGSLVDFLSAFAYPGRQLPFDIISVAKPEDIGRQKLNRDQSSILRSVRTQYKISDEKVYIFSFKASFFTLISLVHDLENNNFVKKIWHISSEIVYNGDQPYILTSMILELR